MKTRRKLAAFGVAALVGAVALAGAGVALAQTSEGGYGGPAVGAGEVAGPGDGTGSEMDGPCTMTGEHPEMAGEHAAMMAEHGTMMRDHAGAMGSHAGMMGR